ncbi:uncharacterized protein [Temnothorax longispinosus]|uniref:uncharacterized protein n=1 Tax=Temnothorax longispinosus TaxID=300112 RepID=UPI003A998920
MKDSQVLDRVGLKFEQEPKLNPRLLIRGVPRGMTGDKLRSEIVALNLRGVDTTELKPSIPDRMVVLRGYNVFKRDRIGKTGGGVAFYLKENAHARILRQSEENYCRKPEYLMAEISMDGNSKILLAVVYRPPHCGYIEEFFNVFSELSALYRHTVVFGDFNADLGTRTFNTEQIRSLVGAVHFHLVSHEPTHHTRTSSTWLDLCIIDDPDKLVAYDLVDITYKMRVELLQRRHIVARNFRSFDLETFLNELAEYDWSSVFTAEDIDSKIRILNDLHLLKCFDKHAPLRNVYPKHLPAPWLTDAIKRKMKKRNTARRKWKRFRNDTNYDNYKHLRNQVQSLIHKAKCSYYQDVFQDLREPNIIWNRLKHLGLIKNKSSEMKLLFSTEELVDFFTYGAAGTARDARHAIAFYLGEETYDDSKFYLGNIEPGEAHKAITRIKSDAPSHMYLTSVYRMEFILPWYGVYPTLWKSAIIQPLPKVKSPSKLKDYRSISILCTVSKALEHIVAEQIKVYLDNHNLLDPHQSAYRKDHSTHTALIRILDDVRQAADARKVTIAIFFDFSIAFDTVDHYLFINKLRNLGFSCSALRWLCSYLYDRRQVVRDPVSRATSTERTTTTGVPQGSVLGPLLFTLYLCGFVKVLGHCKYNFYADDLCIYLYTDLKFLAEAVQKVNQDISNIVAWATENRLFLNSSKITTAITQSSHYHGNDHGHIPGTARYLNGLTLDDLPHIVVDGTLIPYQESVVYLGVTISNTLFWREQVSKTVSRVNASVHQLKLCKHLMPPLLRARLICTLIIPLFDYCCTTYIDITREHNTRLQRALNTCVRFVC